MPRSKTLLAILLIALGSIATLFACVILVVLFWEWRYQAPAISQAEETTLSASPGFPYPDNTEMTLQVQPLVYPVVTTPASVGLNASAYPGPGETKVVSVTSSPTFGAVGGYPPPGNLPTSTATPGQNNQYPGPQTPGNLTPNATFLFPTPDFGTPQIVTPTPAPAQISTRTPIPPPAWITSNLRASDPYTVKLSSGKVQLITFFAFWDGASQAMAPLLHSVEEIYHDRMNFIYLDIDDPATGKFKEELGYKIQPQYFLVDPQGYILQEWVGYVTINELTEAIESALQ
jgi:thiol-disulfide isomerase/thioredoxin